MTTEEIEVLSEKEFKEEMNHIINSSAPNKLEAVKLCKIFFNIGLKEAKNEIDVIFEGRPDDTLYWSKI